METKEIVLYLYRMRVSNIKYVYNLDYIHLTFSAVIAGANLWMMNKANKERLDFEMIKHEWYSNQLKNMSKK
jgi:hypothetical protein